MWFRQKGHKPGRANGHVLPTVADGHKGNYQAVATTDTTDKQQDLERFLERTLGNSATAAADRILQAESTERVCGRKADTETLYRLTTATARLLRYTETYGQDARLTRAWSTEDRIEDRRN